MKNRCSSFIRLIAVILLVVAMVLTLVCCGKKDNKKADGGNDPVQTGSIQTGDDKEEISFSIRVTGPDGKTKNIPVKTTADNLADALIENDLVEGEDSEYGFFITAVDGIKAEDGYFWALVDKEGAMLQTGASSTPVKDGDTFGFEYTKIDY